MVPYKFIIMFNVSHHHFTCEVQLGERGRKNTLKCTLVLACERAVGPTGCQRNSSLTVALMYSKHSSSLYIGN